MSTPERGVIVIWLSSSSEDENEAYIHVVSNGDGSSRIYDVDHVDPRCGDPRYYPTLDLALQEIEPGPENAVKIPVYEAARYGLM